MSAISYFPFLLSRPPGRGLSPFPFVFCPPRVYQTINSSALFCGRCPFNDCSLVTTVFVVRLMASDAAFPLRQLAAFFGVHLLGSVYQLQQHGSSTVVFQFLAVDCAFWFCAPVLAMARCVRAKLVPFPPNRCWVSITVSGPMR